MAAIMASSKKTDDKIDALAADLQQVRNDMATELAAINSKVEDDIKEAKEELRKENEQLRRELERVEFHDRKYNLVFSGLEWKKGEEEAAILSLCTDRLNLQKPTLINVHGLGGDRIIARFLKWTERTAVLENAKKLKGTKIGISTDLPKRLREKRAELLKVCKTLRESEGLQARVIQKGQDIILQTRADGKAQWETKK